MNRKAAAVCVVALLATTIALPLPAPAVTIAAISANRGQVVNIKIKGGLALSRWNLECIAGNFTAFNLRGSDSTFVSWVYVRTSAIVSLSAPSHTVAMTAAPCPKLTTVADVLASSTLAGPTEIANDRGEVFIGSVSTGATSLRVSPYCRAHKFLLSDGDTSCNTSQKPVTIPFADVTLITAVTNG